MRGYPLYQAASRAKLTRMKHPSATKAKTKKAKAEVPFNPVLFAVTVSSRNPTANDLEDSKEREDDAVEPQDVVCGHGGMAGSSLLFRAGLVKLRGMKHPAKKLGAWLKKRRQHEGLVLRVFAGQIELSPAEYAEAE